MRPLQTYNFNNKCALVRADLNVPMRQGQIVDAHRLQASLETLRTITEQGGKVVLLSHLGRPVPGSFTVEHSLRPVAEWLSQKLTQPVTFEPDCLHPQAASKIEALPRGGILLLENLRFWAGECANDQVWAKELARWGDVYVQDAFGMVHRAHASMTHLAHQFDDRLAGWLVHREIEAAKRLLHKPSSPYTVLIGGKKVDDKIAPLHHLLPHTDTLLIAGGAALPFQNALRRRDGNPEHCAVAKVLDTAQRHNVEIVLPQDVMATSVSDPEEAPKSFHPDNVPLKWHAWDIGPKTQNCFSAILQKSRTLLWCGPVGVFEQSGFQEGTRAMMRAFDQATRGGAFTAIGGGESAAAFRAFRTDEQVSHISTGGSALLAYLAQASLPGINALHGLEINRSA